MVNAEVVRVCICIYKIVSLKGQAYFQIENGTNMCWNAYPNDSQNNIVHFTETVYLQLIEIKIHSVNFNDAWKKNKSPFSRLIVCTCVSFNACIHIKSKSALNKLLNRIACAINSNVYVCPYDFVVFICSNGGD